MKIGDKYADENGTEWIITAVFENGYESIGNPPRINSNYISPQDTVAELEATVTDLVQLLTDKGVIY